MAEKAIGKRQSEDFLRIIFFRSQTSGTFLNEIPAFCSSFSPMKNRKKKLLPLIGAIPKLRDKLLGFF